MKSEWMKSCPRCSEKAGKTVFKPYPEAFGETEKRNTQRHKGAQSWCTECRSEKREVPTLNGARAWAQQGGAQ